MRRRWMPLLALLVLCAVPACGSAPVSAANSDDRAPVAASVRGDGPAAVLAVRRGSSVNVLFVGASITAGYFASTLDRAYPELVVSGLESQGYSVNVRVIARAGTTVRLASTWDVSVPSDLVIVQLATNDFLRSRPLPAFEAGYLDVLRQVREASPRALLLCVGGWDNPARMNRLGIAGGQYDIAARSACVDVGGRYVDVSQAYLDPSNHGPRGRPTFIGPGDQFHPNDRGHQQLASGILTAIHAATPARSGPNHPPAA